MRFANAVMAAAALSMSGCGLFDGENPCDKADAAASNIAAKSSSCSGITLPAVKGQAECETALKSCNEAEKAVIDEEMVCLSKVGACVAGDEDAFLQDIAACAAPVAVLSGACKQGFGL